MLLELSQEEIQQVNPENLRIYYLKKLGVSYTYQYCWLLFYLDKNRNGYRMDGDWHSDGWIREGLSEVALDNCENTTHYYNSYHYKMFEK